MRASVLLGVLCVLGIGCRDQPQEQAVTSAQGEKKDVLVDRRDEPRNQAAPPAPVDPERAAAQTGGRPQDAAGKASPAPASPAPASRGDALVACQPGAEVEQTAARLIEMADTNDDGKISREEARSLTSFIVGGFFFRADADGDGVVTPDEGKGARAELESRHPALASLFRGVRSATGQSPFATLAKLLDVDYGQPLAMSEARDAARNAVNDLFGVADSDKDGVITLAEARTAAWQGTRALGHAAFRAADTDRDGSLSEQEFLGALQTSGRTAFGLADTNRDGKLAEDEAASAMSRITAAIAVQPPAIQ